MESAAGRTTKHRGATYGLAILKNRRLIPGVRLMIGERV
jgi:hypothetical protein